MLQHADEKDPCTHASLLHAQAWAVLLDTMRAKYQAGKPMVHRTTYPVLPCKPMGVKVRLVLLGVCVVFGY